MSVTKHWYRSYEFDSDRKNPVGSNAYVLHCDHCGKIIYVIARGPADLEVKTGWSIMDHEECYCEECK